MFALHLCEICHGNPGLSVESHRNNLHAGLLMKALNAKPLGRFFLDVFFPVSCVHCGGAVEDAGYPHLCRSCARELFLARPPACTTCGFPFMGVLAGPQICPHCLDLDPVFDRGKTLFLAKGPGRSLIHELKYKSGSYAFEDVSQILRLSPHYIEYLKGGTLVPVPLHPAKQRERGYNQSERIARFLAREVGDCQVACLLRRVKYTETQTRLNRETREKNVKNAFALSAGAAVDPSTKFILVDDVFTTGSTLNACAAVLRKAGARQLKVATLGHG
jgi:competence protein ComFC